MSYRVLSRDEHLADDDAPKRILALDGGGLRGILSLGFLQRIEDLLRERHGGSPDFRLSHYFDLVAGTSTGAIIAAAIALGWTVDEVLKKYKKLGESVFEKSLLRKGLLRAKYDEKRLSEELRRAFGADTRLGGPELETGLMIVTKRIDTGSPWPLSNNPKGKYFPAGASGVIGNCDYPLWQVVRASTAAPTFFDPEKIEISVDDGRVTQLGRFVDGGVSPFNNPAFQALLYATLEGYRVGWSLGADHLLLVSVGTGAADPSVAQSKISAAKGLKALVALMADSASLQEMLLQWLSQSPTAREIDGEVGNLANDLLVPGGALTYLRYDVELSKEPVRKLKPDVDAKQLKNLTAMDAPENLGLLHELGVLGAARQVEQSHFPGRFDLR